MDKFTKRNFIEAYLWAYGGTKKEAIQTYKESGEDYVNAIIESFTSNAKKHFYSD